MDAKDIEIKYKLDPKTIKGLENFSGFVVIGVGSPSGLSVALEKLERVTVSPFFVDEMAEINTKKIDKVLVGLSAVLLSSGSKLSKLSHELDLVSRGDMLTEFDEKKIFVESPSRDFNVKGQELIWMKGRK